jgi:tetratricopeptide (TPR) repeat protein
VILANLLSRLFRHGAARSASADRQALDAALQQGYRSQRAGDGSTAEQHYRHALEIDPASVDAHYLLGALLGKRQQLQEAFIHLQQAVSANPEFADAHAALGNVHLLQENKPAAMASYQRALQLAPDNAAAHSNLPLIFQSSGKREDALRHFLRAYELAPDLPDALNNLVLLWIELEQYDAALARLNQVLLARPDAYDALKCMGYALQKMHCPDKALEYYERARRRRDSDAELFNNLGIVLQDLGRLDEAIASYDRALAFKPDFELALWHRSLAYLLQHDFARGWKDYDLRLRSVDQPRRPAAYPRWDGTDLAGRRLLVYAEQGLGDEIMFASCLPQVIAASRHCAVECSPKLETLFRRSFPSATVYATTPSRDFPPIVRDQGIDLQIAMGSLPQYLRRSGADFPRHQGYLRADPARVDVWRRRLATGGAGLKVGISWRGGTPKSRQTARSIPLVQWLPILSAPGVQFVNLQYADSATELAELEAATGFKIVDWPEARSEYDETAALLCALDLVISVCTAVIHLGGALGKPVWVMAPYSPEWRYGIAGEKMPWYPSVRIFRQPGYAAWGSVIANVAQSLRDLAQGDLPRQH